MATACGISRDLPVHWRHATLVYVLWRCVMTTTSAQRLCHGSYYIQDQALPAGDQLTLQWRLLYSYIRLYASQAVQRPLCVTVRRWLIPLYVSSASGPVDAKILTCICIV